MTTHREALPPEAVQRLIENRQQFLSFLEKRVESRAAAEDILQAAFVRGLESGGTVRDEESAVAWFYRILRNAIIDHYRHRAASDRVAGEIVHEFEDQHVPDFDTRNEICRCVMEVLQDLKPEYREAIEIVDIGEKSLADLASQSEISANNAAVRVHRAREALRKRVTTACGVCATHGCIDCTCGSGKT